MREKAESFIYRALRALEPYTKTDMVYLARGGFWLTFGQFFISGASFILAIAFANLLPKEVYGQYKYILALSGILTMFSLTGLGAAMIQSVARGNQGELRFGFRASILWGLPMMSAGLAAAVYYAVKDNYILSLSLGIAAIALPFLNSALLYQSFLNGVRDFRALTTYNIARSLFPIPFLIGTAFVTQSVVVLILVYYFTNTIAALYAYIRVLRTYQPTETAEKGTIGYAMHLSVIGILGGVAEQIDGILVFQYLGAAELAMYTFATAMPEQIRSVLKNIYPLMLPKLTERIRDNGDIALGRKLLKLGIVSGGIAGLYILSAPLLFAIFFPQYSDVVTYSQWYALMMVFSTMGILPATILQVREDNARLYLYHTVAQTSTILFLFLGVMFFGFIGMIIARIGTEALKLCFILFLLQKSPRYQ